jgi:hypothetical protein
MKSFRKVLTVVLIILTIFLALTSILGGIALLAGLNAPPLSQLEGAGLSAFSTGPGLVPTETASRAVSQLAPRIGMTVDEFFALNKIALLSIEEAGAGFAASIVFAEKFRGQEISSLQALKAADIQFGAAEAAEPSASIRADHREEARALCGRVRLTLDCLRLSTTDAKGAHLVIIICSAGPPGVCFARWRRSLEG